MLSKAPALRNVEVSLTDNRLVITGQADKQFKVDIPVDVVSVDNKLYAVPREFSVFKPIDLSELAAKVSSDVKPVVEYIELASDIYVPKDYVNEEIMRKLQELENQYAGIKLIHVLNQQGGEELDNYDEFENLVLKRLDIIFEQANLLIAELQKKGFKFEAGGVIEVTGPDGDVGYFVTFNHFTTFSQGRVDKPQLRGKWSFLGSAVYRASLHRYWNSASPIGQEESKKKKYEERGAEECVAVPLYEGDNLVFACGGFVAVPLKSVYVPTDPLHVVKCVKVDKHLCLALSFAPVHESSASARTFGLLSQGTLRLYTYEISQCRFCKTITNESMNFIEHPADAVSVDGELKLVLRDSLYDIIDVDQRVKVDSGIKPSVEYTKLASGIYVPKGYVDKELLRKIAGAADQKEQARLLVEELKKRGFELKWVVEGGDKADAKIYKVEIVGPDGEKSYYQLRDDRANRRTSELYEGKWSLLGRAVLRL